MGEEWKMEYKPLILKYYFLDKQQQNSIDFPTSEPLLGLEMYIFETLPRWFW